MANITPRYQPGIITNILLLVLLIYSPGCISIPDYCIGGDEYTPYSIDLHVVELNASLKQSTAVRTMKFRSYDQDPDIYSAFGQGVRYSADGSALVLNNDNAQFLHYGVIDALDDSLWQEQESVSIYPGYHRFTTADIYPPRHEIIFSALNYDSLKNPYTGRSYINRLSGSTLDMQSAPGTTTKVLLSYKATFYDSTRYRSTEVVTPRFDEKGNVVFIAKESYYKVTSDSTAQHFYFNLYYQENRLLRLHPDHSLDTLFELPTTVNSGYINVADMQYTPGAIAVDLNNALYIFNDAGDELFHADNTGKFMMSADGSAVTYGNGRYYHRFSDDKQLDLSHLVSDITFAQPYAQQVLVTEQRDTLHIVDVNTEKVIQTVTRDQLPDLVKNNHKHSITGIYYPLLTPDNHLRLIYLDYYYIDDPNDPCD